MNGLIESVKPAEKPVESGATRRWGVGRRVLAIVGVVFAAAAVFRVIADFEAASWRWDMLQMQIVGQIWHEIAPMSLHLLQAAVERHITPWLWSDLLFPLILTPVWVVCLSLAAVCFAIVAVLGARRSRRG